MLMDSSRCMSLQSLTYHVSTHVLRSYWGQDSASHRQCEDTNDGLGDDSYRQSNGIQSNFVRDVPFSRRKYDDSEDDGTAKEHESELC